MCCKNLNDDPVYHIVGFFLRRFLLFKAMLEITLHKTLKKNYCNMDCSIKGACLKILSKLTF